MQPERFTGLVVALLVLDLAVLNRRSHVLSFKEAMSWSAGLIAFALLFGLFILWREGTQPALEYYTGYLIELSLSVDNLFVFILIFMLVALAVRAPAWRRVGLLTLAAFVASLWSRYGHRVNLGLFFQVTAVFLMIFVVQLLIYGFHELTEANLLDAVGEIANTLAGNARRTLGETLDTVEASVDFWPFDRTVRLTGTGFVNLARNFINGTLVLVPVVGILLMLAAGMSLQRGMNQAALDAQYTASLGKSTLGRSGRCVMMLPFTE